MATIAGCRTTVYLIGAQSTGKTTLFNALKTSYDGTNAGNFELGKRPVFIPEVARVLLKKKGFSREETADSPTLASELQKCILEAQLKAETTAFNSTSTTWCICDRSGLDPIVYAQLFVGGAAADEMIASPAWEELERKMKEGIVFMCEAGCSWLVDDGTRAMPESMEVWMEVDSAFRKMLDARAISYNIIPRDVEDIADRVKLVKDASTSRVAVEMRPVNRTAKRICGSRQISRRSPPFGCESSQSACFEWPSHCSVFPRDFMISS